MFKLLEKLYFHWVFALRNKSQSNKIYILVILLYFKLLFDENLLFFLHETFFLPYHQMNNDVVSRHITGKSPLRTLLYIDKLFLVNV